MDTEDTVHVLYTRLQFLIIAFFYRIEPKPQEKIKICLGETLEVLHEIKKKSFVLRLNARFVIIDTILYASPTL